MAYLSFMYLAYTSADFYSGYYSLTLDQTVTNRKYSIDVPNNGGENYTSFGTNKIAMKGFLVGYKLKQGSAAGFSLNFTLAPLNATFFRVTVETYEASTIESIWYYRIGYDQTFITRRDPTSVFRENYYFELTNGVDTSRVLFKTKQQGGFTIAIGLQYRNYLMGTNKINFLGAGPRAI